MSEVNQYPEWLQTHFNGVVEDIINGTSHHEMVFVSDVIAQCPCGVDYRYPRPPFEDWK